MKITVTVDTKQDGPGLVNAVVSADALRRLINEFDDYIGDLVDTEVIRAKDVQSAWDKAVEAWGVDVEELE